MFRKAVFTLLFTVPLAWASPASAAFINFDPDGPGAAASISIDLLDPAPGNVISINGGLGSGSASVESLFQANLAGADNSTTPFLDYSNGALNPDGSRTFFTVVAGIPEIQSVTGTSISLTFNPAGASATPTATNYFYIYETTVPSSISGNNLSGVCFTCGNLILQGVFQNDAAFANSFVLDTTPTGALVTGALDQFGTNNYPTVSTLTGTGGLKGDVLVTSANNNWFPGMVAGGIINWAATTQNNLPFLTSDPSACFNMDGLGAVASCGDPGQYLAAGSANVGATNGLGKDTMLQSDSSFSFSGTTTVPEPATLALLGVGLLGVVQVRRRQNKAKK